MPADLVLSSLALGSASVSQGQALGFVYTHKWRQGDAVMWDNRAMLHRGRPWDYKKERSMIRTTISATDADGLAEVRPPVVH